MSLDVQDDILKELVNSRGMDLELVRELLRLAYDCYPNLDQYGQKTTLERKIRATIERAMANMENT